MQYSSAKKSVVYSVNSICWCCKFATKYCVVSVGSNIKKEYYQRGLITKKCNSNTGFEKTQFTTEYIEVLAKMHYKKPNLLKQD